MDIMEKIYARAAADPQKVAFPEATEEKILLACRECADKGLIRPVLVGDPAAIKEAADGYGIDLNGMEICDATDEAFLTDLVAAYYAQNSMLSEKNLMRRAKNDFVFTALYMLAVITR